MSVAARSSIQAHRRWTLAWAVTWFTLVMTVQPWSATGSNAAKGGALGLALLVALFSLDPDARMRVPRPLWVFLVHAAVILPVCLTVDQPGNHIVKWARLVVSVVVIMVFAGRMVDADHRLALWHLYAHAFLGLVVLAGAVLAPGRAFAKPDGDANGATRLVGVILPLAAPRVGEVGALMVGLSTILVAFGLLGRWRAASFIVTGAALMVLSGTRTAMVSTAVSLFAAFVATRRLPAGRRALRIFLGLGCLGVLALPYALSFLMRGQDLKLLFSLTGRTFTWRHIMSLDLPASQFWLGHGIGEFTILMHRSDNTYAPMPIDNGFVALYWTSGMVGVLLMALFLILVWAKVVSARTSPAKGAAAFLVTFVTIATVTESGLGDLSSHTLHLLAALYLASATRWRDLTRRPGPVGRVALAEAA